MWRCTKEGRSNLASSDMSKAGRTLHGKKQAIAGQPRGHALCAKSSIKELHDGFQAVTMQSHRALGPKTEELGLGFWRNIHA